MGFFQQFKGQANRAALLKVRSPFKLFVEIFLPGVVFFIIASFKASNPTEDLGPQEYAVDARQLPTVNDLLELPSNKVILEEQTRSPSDETDDIAKGYWYLEYLGEFESHGSANFAYSCALEPVPVVIFTAEDDGTLVTPGPRRVLARDGDFDSICQQLSIAVVPESRDNIEQVQLASRYKENLIATVSESNRDQMIDRLAASDSVLDRDGIQNYVRSPKYGTEDQPPLGAIVIFSSEKSYTIQVNRTSEGKTDFARSAPNIGGINSGAEPWSNVPDLGAPAVGTDKEGSTKFTSQYFYSGYLTLQHSVERFLMNDKLGEANDIPETTVNIVAMPTLITASDPFWRDTPGMLALFMLLAMLVPSAVQTNTLLVDKESKFRELMLTMGLAPSAWMFGWLVVQLLLFLPTIFIAVVATSATGVFGYSDVLIFTIFQALFFFASVAYSFLVASFFERANVGMATSVLLSFVGYLAFSNFDYPVESSLGVKVILSIFHPIAAFGYGTLHYGINEANIRGVTLENFASSGETNYTVLTAIIILAFDFVLYILGAAYVDSIMPSTTASGRNPWHWPVTSLSSRGASNDLGKSSWYQSAVSKQEADENEVSKQIPLEPVEGQFKDARANGRCIMIDNVEKTYQSSKGSVHAVRGVTFSIFENQITVLLGSNGAGKTTLSSILSGLTDASKGRAIVNGLSCADDMRDIRRTLGVCTQQNILSGIMSVDEHLRLFASIKGIPPRKINRKIIEILEDVGLTKKRHVESMFLSGGMKRKLQLAIALLDAKVCILDEPTSGLDVAARQLVQRTIARYKKNRSIILTTHYMDEADVLGDRIAIMANGKLECCGSSLFLKSKYGVGYQITVVQSNAAGPDHREALKSLVRSFLPEMLVVTDAGAELTVRVPLSSSKAFPGLLRELDSNTSLMVNNTGVSITNLETVFLRVIDGVSPDSSETDAPSSAGEVVVPGDEDVTSLNVAENEDWAVDIDYAPTTFFGQVPSLFRKRVITATRESRSFCAQILAPMLFLVLGMASFLVGSDAPFGVRQIGVGLEEWAPEGESIRLPLQSNLFALDEWLLSGGEEGPRAEKFPFEAEEAPYCANYRSYEDHVSVLNQTFTAADGIIGWVDERGFDNSEYFENIFARLREFAYDDFCDLRYNRDITVLISEEDPDNPEYRFLAETASEPFIKALGQFNGQVFRAFDTFYGGILGNTFEGSSLTEATVAYNLSARHAGPLMINRLNSALVSRELNEPFNLVGQIEIFPETLGEEERRASVNSFAATLSIVITFSFIPATYSVFIVRERESKAWHQQLVNGVSPVAYWLSNFVFDFLTFLFPMVVGLALIFAFSVTPFVEEFTAVVAVFVWYGATIVPFTYVVSHFFSSSAFAQFGTLMFHMLGSTVLLLISYMMSLFPGTLLSSVTLTTVARVLPSFAFGHAILSVTNIGLIQNQINAEALGGDPANPRVLDAFSPEIVGNDIIALMVMCVVSWIFLIFQVRVFRNGACKSTRCQTFKPPSEEETGIQLEDEDVREQRLELEHYSEAELRNLTKSEDSDIKAVFRGVRKVYNDGNVAVQNLTFSLKKNECFGLLGTNGAGKTTTQSMLSGEFKPQMGSIYLDGENVVKDPAAAQRRMGYCPQANAIFDLLTAREHLTFYAEIKGVPSYEIPLLVERTLRELALTKFADKMAGGYSGGNKRKLSMAMATLGSPALVLLDEPSAGIDPTARRMLTVFIEKLSKRTTVVLTTHSMEECEALCNRVGIMVDGGLRCLNTIQSIKDKYGKGYQFEASFKLASADEIQQKLDTLDFEAEAISRTEVLDMLKTGSHLHKAFKASAIYGSMSSALATVRLKTVAEWIILEESIQTLTELLKARFSKKVKLIERQGRRIRFNIPSLKSLTTADMFEVIESERASARIEDFSIAQTTLERVFLNFAAGAVLTEKKKKKKKKQTKADSENETVTVVVPEDDL